MLRKGKITSEKAFKEACKKNGLIYKKHSKGTKTEYVKLMDEEGNIIRLNDDLTITKCSIDNDDEMAASELVIQRTEVKKGLKSPYKIQKGLQKA
ncbi:hypothetical protein DFR55_101205 [Herbinix hemicellulosilytica]|uniref:Uncharacterized protein n=1 Tax=Herbinix hemicellulosilytica TaxID=1564487 RepID=A0A0H5SG13_HERHM|nr:hypothetical protein [Herbinix hemicellulosilytica]RBP60745.1 hypothetical protein DFR55_101205 [Herbinix hemicellulosilytica]CRZ34432.1 hypothetical protein HHT355_1230 [Herbinix hemicellulosilytica]HPU63942.1 hypothetical protein [Mobilitalea sp.]